ncbi:MAG: SDR family oxidoreductase [Chitinophagaceae bacterium]
MKILITGANGYIGQRLVHALLAQSHQLVCCVRDKARFQAVTNNEQLQVIENDFMSPDSGTPFPADIDGAYFLIHSMREGAGFEDSERMVAKEFLRLVEKTRCRQIIYLSGIVNERTLSAHLSSRLAVEQILEQGKIPLTVLRAGIVVGSGSSSFEIIRDLVEKLPVMITPKWVTTKCQPIGVRNVIEFLSGVLLKEKYYHKNFDIGGTDVLTYKEMMLRFAEERKLKRIIITVPVMTPKLSSYWLYFVTSTSYALAKNLVDSMKVNVVCRPNTLAAELRITLLSYREAVAMAFQKIEQNEVVSSWKDAFSAFNTNPSIGKNADVPSYGCFKDVKQMDITGQQDYVFRNIWGIGGEKGWFYGNSLWRARGFLDKAFGGVGLRRGRTHSSSLHAGDSLDFWRVLVADKTNQRLLLYAEMKLPGEAWLEFKAEHTAGKIDLVQTATFRPRGLWGRLYWYSVLPFHYFIFNGMIKNIVRPASPALPEKIAG